jgi:hypothetical protein
MTNEEITRLGILVLEVPQAPPPLPCYATDIMPAGLTEDEALQRVLQNLTPHPPPPPPPAFNPWAAPPQPPATPVYVPPAANWLWPLPDFFMIGDEDEE